jgi:hypothetical protein
MEMVAEKTSQAEDKDTRVKAGTVNVRKSNSNSKYVGKYNAVIPLQWIYPKKCKSGYNKHLHSHVYQHNKQAVETA